jgi:hypothetical protein
MTMLNIRERTTDTCAVRVYHSVEHALRVAEHGGVWKSERSSRKGSDGWSGGSFTEAMKLAKYGWRDGAKSIRQAFANLPSPSLSAGNAWRHDYYGERIDMARFSYGDDACFRNRAGADRGRAKLVRILVPMAYPCSTSDTDVINRGSAIISVVDALEMTRRTVELVCCYASTSSGSRKADKGFHMNHAVVVKQAGQPFDIERMAFFLSHTASLRRIGFALMESVAEAEDSHRSGYGYGCDIHADDQSANTIALPELHGGKWNTPEKARETLASIVREKGHALSFR